MTIRLVNAAVEATALAAGDRSHAEGSQSSALGAQAHAEGTLTVASGTAAHAEGSTTTASGAYAHTEGSGTTASASYARAQGRGAWAQRHGQHAQSSFLASSVQASSAQWSLYTTGGLLPSGNGSTVELVFTADGVVSPAGSVLTVPLKSVLLARYDIVARPNNDPDVNANGVYWTGTMLLGRGNATGTTASYSQGAAAPATAPLTLPQTYSFDSLSAAVSLQCSIVSTDTTNNYWRLLATNGNTAAIGFSLMGVLQVVELYTNT